MEKTTEKQQITPEDFAIMKKRWETIVMAVFSAEEKLNAERLLLHMCKTYEDYIGAVMEEILLSTYKITE